MLKNLFKKNTGELKIYAPLEGKVVDLNEVPDPVFAERMMGEGVAIEPVNGEVVSPVDGEIVQLFHTNHAVGIKTKSGVEVLVHIGLETVSMEGEGFEGHVKAGDKVKTGDKLITFDMNLVQEKAKSTITPIIITNYNDVAANMEQHTMDNAIRGETEIMMIQMK
ncbi:PTS sugar transporter subunit IIA [Thalassobacillus devorans]|uniref:PTS sugar transporter subunit IIA n=1 Tax=Thalassobacillus devorans TaxID=279813 RepID=UPI000A1C908D|nr:PTS glucose transporter subunit IIA [Thalassobacillus devorans]